MPDHGGVAEKGLLQRHRQHGCERLNDSIMIQLLSHKMKDPASTGEYRPEADDLTCSADRKEVAGYLKKHPNRECPSASRAETAGIRDHRRLAGAGRKRADAAQQQLLTMPEARDAREIVKWEAFLTRMTPSTS